MSTRRACSSSSSLAVFALSFFRPRQSTSALARPPTRDEQPRRSCAPKSALLRSARASRPPARPATARGQRVGDARRREPRVADRRRHQAAAAGRDGPASARPAARPRESFVELYSYDNRGTTSYGTAGYSATATSSPSSTASSRSGRTAVAEPRKITSVKLIYQGKLTPRDGHRRRRRRRRGRPGDWAIIRVQGSVDLPPLNVEPRIRLRLRRPDLPARQRLLEGHHPRTGYVGQRTANRLVTCLTDGHPGVSGGGVLNRDGRARRHPDRPDAGRLPLLVHPAAARGDVPQGQIRH